MRIKVRNRKISKILDNVLPLLPYPLSDVDKNTRLTLSRISKRSEGRLKVVPMVVVNCIPCKKRSDNDFEVWDL